MSALLVPIQVDALVVRDTSESWARTKLDEPKPVAGRRKRQQLLPDPFQLLNPPRPEGVYLHWALPDGLTRGSYTKGAGADAAFPAVPNRWLVLRLSGAATPGPRNVSGWLLPDLNAKQPFRLDVFSGAALPAPGSKPERPLTALGHGDLAWAGYYDNVVDRFGIYDDLNSIATGPLAYLVCGWYTDPALDPVTAPTESAFLQKLQELGWSLDPPAAPRPSASVYHGAAVSIGWPEQSWEGDGGSLGTELDARPALGSIDAAVGQTLAEALAAMTTTEEDPPEFARLLEGLFAAALPELAQPDGAAQLDTALHLARFGSRPAAAASEWIWQPTEGGEPPQPTPPAAGDASAPESGGLHEALAASDGGEVSEIPVDMGVGSFVSVRRSKPRVWHVIDPAIALRGAGRSFKHGGDGRFTASGHLACRVETDTVTEFGIEDGDVGSGAAVLPATPLAAVPASYGVPAACARLLVEAACLDPGSAPDLEDATDTEPSPVAAARARWWTSFDPEVSPEDALQGAHVLGTLPSAVAVTPPTRPWTPLHLEWSAEYLPSPRGAHDWELGEIDFEPAGAVSRPPVDTDHPLLGRVMLSAAPASVQASAARVAEADAAIAGAGVSDALGAAADAVRSGLSLANALGQQDLLAGALAGIAAQLRLDPTGAIVQEAGTTTEGELSAGPRPAAFVPLRAGFMRLARLRLVDTYGQLLDLLPGPLVPKPGLGMGVDGQPDLLGLTPRFTAPARVLLRYAVATGARVDADPGLSPVCGYLVPSPLDGTLEFFDAEGVALGRLRPDPLTRTAWEEDPGQPAALGALPSRWMQNQFLAGFADNLLAADTAAARAAARGEEAPRRPALESLLRAIDTTRWTVDLTGGSGDEHLSLLLGQPVAVLRATIKVEVEDPRQPRENAETAVAVKLGALAHRQDGLLAYVVDDDFTRVRLVDSAVAELALSAPGNGEGAERLDSPFLDSSGVFHVNPGRPVPLTLLVMPGTDVHVTTGFVPQKRVGMLRNWMAPALSRLSPALRYGPVLRHAETTRLPVPSDIRGTWHWHRRPDGISWETDDVVSATADAVVSDAPALVSDGWLQVELAPDTLYRKTAISIRISCVHRVRGRIAAVGGENPNGSRFLIPVAEAAAFQESGRFSFYVQEEGAPKVDVRVITTRRGVRYLRTMVDRRDPNNLGRLRECPTEDE